MAEIQGYVIVGPVSPWDEPHRDSIEAFNAKSTFGETSTEAWSKQLRTSEQSFDAGERARRIQHWHDRGYRLRKATLTIHPQEEPND